MLHSHFLPAHPLPNHASSRGLLGICGGCSPPITIYTTCVGVRRCSAHRHTWRWLVHKWNNKTRPERQRVFFCEVHSTLCNVPSVTTRQLSRHYRTQLMSRPSQDVSKASFTQTPSINYCCNNLNMPMSFPTAVREYYGLTPFHAGQENTQTDGAVGRSCEGW